jgi:hypothetical protein
VGVKVNDFIYLFISRHFYRNGHTKSKLHDLSTGIRTTNIEYNNTKPVNSYSMWHSAWAYISDIMSEEDYNYLKLLLYSTISMYFEEKSSID